MISRFVQRGSKDERRSAAIGMFKEMDGKDTLQKQRTLHGNTSQGFGRTLHQNPFNQITVFFEYQRLFFAECNEILGFSLLLLSALLFAARGYIDKRWAFFALQFSMRLRQKSIIGLVRWSLVGVLHDACCGSPWLGCYLSAAWADSTVETFRLKFTFTGALLSNFFLSRVISLGELTPVALRG